MILSPFSEISILSSKKIIRLTTLGILEIHERMSSVNGAMIQIHPFLSLDRIFSIALDDADVRVTGFHSYEEAVASIECSSQAS